LRNPKDVEAAVSAILKAKKEMPGVFHGAFYNNPEEHKDALWSFLQSGRFHGNPRNLAGAMAGLPEHKWKRSFDICSSHPCKRSLAPEAYWDYMRRNFHERWLELQKATTTEEAKAVLARSRSSDPVYLLLKEHPDRALEYFNAGRPTGTVLPRRSARTLREPTEK
jgi:hypothetical protein